MRLWHGNLPPVVLWPAARLDIPLMLNLPPSLVAVAPSAGSYLANSPANRGGLLLLIFLDSTSRFEQADLALRFPISEAVIRSFCVVLVFGKQESRLRHVLGLLIIRTKSGYNGNTHLLVVFPLPSAPLTSQLRGIERRPRAPRSIFTRLPSVPLVSAQCPYPSFFSLSLLIVVTAHEDET